MYTYHSFPLCVYSYSYSSHLILDASGVDKTLLCCRLVMSMEGYGHRGYGARCMVHDTYAMYSCTTKPTTVPPPSSPNSPSTIHPLRLTISKTPLNQIESASTNTGCDVPRKSRKSKKKASLSMLTQLTSSRPCITS